MKWTMRFAAMLAALVLILSLNEAVRPSAAIANDDVELLAPPPTTKGDPDSGGPGYFVITWNWMIGATKRSISSLMSAVDRRASIQRIMTPTRPSPARTRPR